MQKKTADEVFNKYFPNGIGLIPFELGEGGKEKVSSIAPEVEIHVFVIKEEEKKNDTLAFFIGLGAVLTALAVTYLLVGLL